MNAAAGCCKTWIFSLTLTVVLRAWSGNYASRHAPASSFQRDSLHCIVQAITFATHALSEAMGLKKPPVIFAGILRASIGMDDQASFGPPLPNGHSQCIANQLSLHS